MNQNENENRMMNQEELQRSILEARIKRLEKKVDDYEWIMIMLFIFAVARWFF